MSTVDQFESVFKAAAKTTYLHETPSFGKVLLVTDMEESESTLYLNLVRQYFEKILLPNETKWEVLSKKEFQTVKDLLGKVEEHRPDILITYRNLRSDSWRWPYSLGEHLDVLT